MQSDEKARASDKQFNNEKSLESWQRKNFLIRRVCGKLWRSFKMQWKSVAGILQRLLCMPRAQLHAECYKTQRGCSSSPTAPHTHTHTCTHACHAQIIYVCTHWLALLALPSRSLSFSLLVCVCVKEVCAKHVEQNAKVVKTFAAISS